MKKRLFYIVNFAWLTIVLSLLYYLLVLDTTLHLSIADLFDWARHCTKQGHLLVIGLLPIYLGLLIFGATILFIYLRAQVWPILSQYLKLWFNTSQKS